MNCGHRWARDAAQHSFSVSFPWTVILLSPRTASTSSPSSLSADGRSHLTEQTETLKKELCLPHHLHIYAPTWIRACGLCPGSAVLLPEAALGSLPPSHHTFSLTRLCSALIHYMRHLLAASLPHWSGSSIRAEVPTVSFPALFPAPGTAPGRPEAPTKCFKH